MGGASGICGDGRTGVGVRWTGMTGGAAGPRSAVGEVGTGGGKAGYPGGCEPALDGGGRRRLGGGEYGVADGGGTARGRPAVGGEYGVADCGGDPKSWVNPWSWVDRSCGDPYPWGEPYPWGRCEVPYGSGVAGEPKGAEGRPEPSALPRCRAGGGGRGTRRGVTNESV
jgi:hypothetical protein